MGKSPKSTLFLAIGMIAGALTLSCDPLRKGKCEWFLIPFPDGENTVEPGNVSLCVSNFSLKRKKCHFTAPLDFVEQFNGVPFRYDEMKYSNQWPRLITSITPCTP